MSKKNDINDKWARDENGNILTCNHGRTKMTKMMFENDAEIEPVPSDEEIDKELEALGLGEFIPKD